MKRKKTKLGDIFAIPLPNGTYAFGRLYKEYTLAIYKIRAENINTIPEKDDYDFFVGVYRDVLTDGQWPVIGNIPFIDDSDSWRPPTYMKDIFTGKFSIYHYGEVKPASEQECKGLELTATWDRQHLIDRLMGVPPSSIFGPEFSSFTL